MLLLSFRSCRFVFPLSEGVGVGRVTLLLSPLFGCERLSTALGWRVALLSPLFGCTLLFRLSGC